MLDPDKIPVRTDTFLSYKVSSQGKTLTAQNTRTIEIIDIAGNCHLRLRTGNLPVGKENVTNMTAILRYSDLQLISLDLKSKTDSAHVDWKEGHFTGWSQSANEARKKIDLIYLGNVTVWEGNTPWIPGLFALQEGRQFIIPRFRLFSNDILARPYQVLKLEIINLNGKDFRCWKTDAGPAGPPGYNAFQWYDADSGRLLKTELTKKGEDVKYVSLLKNL